MDPPVVPVVLDRHAEEAAFLWLLRDRAVGLPQFNLRTLAELDQRVEAHLDGLRVAGEAGWRRAWQEFEDRPERGEAFAAAVLALERADADAMGKLLAAAAAEPPLRAGITSAVGWLNDDTAAVALSLLHAWDTPTGRLAGLVGAAVRRTSIPGWVMESALHDPACRPRAIKAVGELGDINHVSAIRKHLAASDLDTRFSTAWSMARLGNDPTAVAELQTIAMTESRYRQRSATLAVRRLDPAAGHRWVRMLTQTPGCERVAIQAAGALGDPAAIPRLIEQMAVPALARLAGEAVSLITGVNLSDEKLDAPQPEGFEAGPNDDPDDGDVDMDPDDGLDWPDPAKVRTWWEANRGRFRDGARHLCGAPITPEHLRKVLREGYQRQRAAAALELALARPSGPLFEVRAPGWRQQVG